MIPPDQFALCSLLGVFGPLLAASAAFVAVSVPLVVHLLFRKRYQIVPWAAIRFLIAAERRSRRRIDQWLLLALRMVALLLPLFAMVAATAWAEPLWQWIEPGRLETISNTPRTHHILVIDGSLSMTARAEDGRNRFDRAIAEAEQLVRSASPGDGFTVIFLAGTAQTVVPGPSNAAGKVIHEIEALKVSHTAIETASALPVVAEALGRSPRGYPRRQVTFFTDLQRSAWASALPKTDAPIGNESWEQIFKGKEGRGAAEVVVVDVARADLDNLAIADLTLSDPFPIVDTPANLTANVLNLGRSERKAVGVELLISRPSASGGESFVSADTRVIDSLPAGGRASVSFPLEGVRTGFLNRGTHIFQVRLVEGDDLPTDDSRFLVVEVRDGFHAMIVDGRKGEVDQLRRGSEYLARALTPPGAKPADTQFRLTRPGARWPEIADDRWILSANEFNDPAIGDPAGADCLILCDYPAMSPAIVAKLEAHLRRGGGLVIGMGPNVVAARESYNRLLYKEGNGILPAPIGELVSIPTDDAGFRLVGSEASFRQLPISAFREDNARAGLVTVPFHGYLKMNPVEGRGRTLLSFVPAGTTVDPSSKPDPAIIEWPRYRGRVVLYTSTFDRDWNEWPVLPTYLPFMHELIRYAAANQDRHTIRVGEAIEEFLHPRRRDSTQE